MSRVHLFRATRSICGSHLVTSSWREMKLLTVSCSRYADLRWIDPP